MVAVGLIFFFCRDLKMSLVGAEMFESSSESSSPLPTDFLFLPWSPSTIHWTDLARSNSLVEWPSPKEEGVKVSGRRRERNNKSVCPGVSGSNPPNEKVHDLSGFPLRVQA